MSLALNLDTVKLLRAVVKISSALNEYDSLMYESKYFKQRFKIEASKWAMLMQLHTDDLMKSLANEDDKLLVEVYSQIENSTKEINAGTDDKTYLVVFYAKLCSALNDIEQMGEYKNTFYPLFIKKYTQDVVTQITKQYRAIIDIKDKDGNGSDYIIKYLDELGSKIMYYGKQDS
jgi:hypothetical protein